jgi:hypothetical protein
MPLVGVVPVLQALLLSVACVFSKPQRRHLENYLQGLICQEQRRTLAAMSRQVPTGSDRSNWERFVTASPWELPGNCAACGRQEGRLGGARSTS